jgi:hypothetical protein
MFDWLIAIHAGATGSSRQEAPEPSPQIPLNYRVYLSVIITIREFHKQGNCDRTTRTLYISNDRLLNWWVDPVQASGSFTAIDSPIVRYRTDARPLRQRHWFTMSNPRLPFSMPLSAAASTPVQAARTSVMRSIGVCNEVNSASHE